MPKLSVHPTHAAFVEAGAEFLASGIESAVATHGSCSVALAGGGTPRPIYARLASTPYAERIAWEKVEVYFGDERCVGPEDPQSNYRMAREAVLDHVPIPAANVHRMRGEEDPAKAAADYEQELRRGFDNARVPILDLICLGLGDDGHTASLFPGTEALHERQSWVVAQYVDKLGSWRLTMTPPLINAARNVVFLVEGSGKVPALRQVMTGPYQPDVLPSQLIAPTGGTLHWILDAAAGEAVDG